MQFALRRREGAMPQTLASGPQAAQPRGDPTESELLPTLPSALHCGFSGSKSSWIPGIFGKRQKFPGQREFRRLIVFSSLLL